MVSHYLLRATTFLLLLYLCASQLRDLDGQPLRANTHYMIIACYFGDGGGLTLLPKNTTSACSRYVGQELKEINTGLPLKFYPVDPKENLISLSSDLNIVFQSSSTCNMTSNVWHLTLEEGTGQRVVGTTGTRGNPGVKTLSNWFRIEEAGTGEYQYKISFCPSVCAFCRVACGDLGILIHKDGRRLFGISAHRLSIIFTKA